MNQAGKAAAFLALHQRDGAFIIPNPWDVGSARLLAGMGFEALATTSVGFAFSAGRRDHQVSRDALLAHAAALVQATARPVSAVPATGLRPHPKSGAHTVRRADTDAPGGCSMGTLRVAAGEEGGAEVGW